MIFHKLKLPRDGGAHRSIIEWWYFNGHLSDAAGKRYAFMDCLFKADLNRIKIPFLKLPLKKTAIDPYVYFAHSVISDLSRRKIYKDIQNISLPAGDSFSRPLLYANYCDPLSLASGYVNCEMAEIEPGHFHIKNSQLDLSLVARQAPLLEGGKGFIEVCGRKSYYYSLTDLQAQGLIKIGKKSVPVSGRAWLDHQWADVAYSRDAWSWFSLQLSDGTDIMCVEYRQGKQRDYLVDIIDKSGRSYHYKQVILEPGRRVWQSPKTKSRYPLEWTIKIVQRAISLKIEASLCDQEMIFGEINYWEGPIKIVGTIGSQKVTGVGFMELVGYDSDYNILALIGQEVGQNIKKSLLAKIHAAWR